ncbi:efflux RND transporter periplasmic adaptor subunit [Roseiconus nitratireducens]|uniref:Efflux RND transporter periplasmic adaptor subunit n=1 Tax=Roseiconus nitratireducens TaxID=2605748 RepID=A0A5M6DE32_9BACT|nr:efflux RND transporter periplasmic adaptor subunit [Roseiconus nitratireducens]KAA5544542.1 efflux RND transporter periplasmic adaptor subunit [Roseiconus nitratireducens]
MSPKKLFRVLAGPAMVVVCLALLWTFRENLLPKPYDATTPDRSENAASNDLKVLELSEQARKNLNLVSKGMRPTDYWRVITIPGMVQDRPGISDRGVTSPAVGVVSQIHVYPGDTVRPGETLVTLQLFSEYLQATQTRLFQAVQEISLVQAELDRVSGLARVGGVSGSRLIELRNEIKRQRTLTQAARQELLTRGLSPSQVDQVESGAFVSTIEVVAPQPRTLDTASLDGNAPSVLQAGYIVADQLDRSIAYEVQELPVELGQTVQAGQPIANLSNHGSLYVVGHAFKREAGFLEIAAQQGRNVQIDFADDTPEYWPELETSFSIRHLSNSIDPESRTFDFFIPLSNQSRTYQKNEETFLVWRFRPGQRVRIHVPVEKMTDVFVMPADAVVSEGPESYVFRQNGDLFNQISVHVLHRDRRNVVIANDGSMTTGAYFAQNAAASLNRVLKAQSASGEQPGLHVHADGTVHAAH